MTDEQTQQLAEAIVAVEYGEFVRSLFDRIDAGEMTLEESLARIYSDPSEPIESFLSKI